MESVRKDFIKQLISEIKCLSGFHLPQLHEQNNLGTGTSANFNWYQFSNCMPLSSLQFLFTSIYELKIRDRESVQIFTCIAVPNSLDICILTCFLGFVLPFNCEPYLNSLKGSDFNKCERKDLFHSQMFHILGINYCKRWDDIKYYI